MLEDGSGEGGVQDISRPNAANKRKVFDIFGLHFWPFKVLHETQILVIGEEGIKSV
jgi:hypothetical protein